MPIWPFNRRSRPSAQDWDAMADRVEDLRALVIILEANFKELSEKHKPERREKL